MNRLLAEQGGETKLKKKKKRKKKIAMIGQMFVDPGKVRQV